MKKFLYLSFFILFLSCDQKKNTQETRIVNDSEQIITRDEGFNFTSEKAARLNEKGIELGSQGNSKEAEKLLLKALEIEPNNPIILNNLGLANSQLKEYKKAISFFEKSLKVSDSLYLNAGINLSMTCFHAHKYQKGVRIATYVMNKSDNTKTTVIASLHKGFCLTGLMKCEEAAKELEFVKTYVNEIDQLEYHINGLKEDIKECMKKKL